MTLTLTTLSPFAKREIENEFRFQMDRNGATADQIRIARAILEVGMVEAFPANVKLAIAAAALLEEQDIRPHQIRTNTRACGITFDLVARSVIRAERALR